MLGVLSYTRSGTDPYQAAYKGPWDDVGKPICTVHKPSRNRDSEWVALGPTGQMLHGLTREQAVCRYMSLRAETVLSRSAGAWRDARRLHLDRNRWAVLPNVDVLPADYSKCVFDLIGTRLKWCRREMTARVWNETFVYRNGGRNWCLTGTAFGMVDPNAQLRMDAAGVATIRVGDFARYDSQEEAVYLTALLNAELFDLHAAHFFTHPVTATVPAAVPAPAPVVTTTTTTSRFTITGTTGASNEWVNPFYITNPPPPPSETP